MFFIIWAIVVAIGFGFWSLRYYGYEKQGVGYLFAGMGSIVGVCGLGVYLMKFIKKMKDIK